MSNAIGSSQLEIDICDWDMEALNSFLDSVRSATAGRTGSLFFRGHSDDSFVSLPKVFRNWGWEDSEEKLLRGLVEMHPEEFTTDQTTLEKLVRAQHFGLPTRLLDVTLNPLVALYFACKDNIEKNGQVIVYSFESERVKTFDSDTMSVIANLALMKAHERVNIDTIVKEHFRKERPLSISEFNRKAPLPRLLHFIQSEKPYFQPKIAHHTFRQFVAVLPKRNNRRMIAQSGAFIAFASKVALTDSTSPKVTISEISVSKKEKGDLLLALGRLNINQGALFPDVGSASEYLSEKHYSDF